MTEESGRRPRTFASRLTLEDAVRIRASYASGTPVRQLVTRYRVSTASIYEVLRGRAHPCVVAVQLSDEVYLKLRAAAKTARSSPVDVAGTLVAQGLARTP